MILLFLSQTIRHAHCSTKNIRISSMRCFPPQLSSLLPNRTLQTMQIHAAHNKRFLLLTAQILIHLPQPLLPPPPLLLLILHRHQKLPLQNHRIQIFILVLPMHAHWLNKRRTSSTQHSRVRLLHSRPLQTSLHSLRLLQPLADSTRLR